MADVIDSYSETNNSNDEFIDGVSGDTSGIGQSFTGNGQILDSCKWFIKKQGSPTGNATAKIYAHSGVFGTSSVPTGAAIATSDNFDVATLTGTYALATFNFSGANRITLTNATKYVVTFEFTGGNGSNSIVIADDSTSPAHAGNSSFFVVAGAWAATAVADMCFYVYGVTADSGGMSLLSNAASMLLTPSQS